MSDLGLSCPAGGKWYACSSGSNFLGCCKSDPCIDGCSKDHELTPASFNASYNGTIQDQDCEAGKFYTCKATDPPFLGCCLQNPCQAGGCPSKKLAAAKFGDTPLTAAAPTTSNNSSSTASTSSTRISSSSTLSTSISSTSASATAVPTSSQTPTLGKGAITGIAVGGAVGLIALFAIIVALCTRRDKRTPPVYNGGYRAYEDDRTDQMSTFQGNEAAAAPLVPILNRDHLDDIPTNTRDPTPTDLIGPSPVSPSSTYFTDYSPIVSNTTQTPEVSTWQGRSTDSSNHTLAPEESGTTPRRPETASSNAVNVGYLQPGGRGTLRPASGNNYSRLSGNGTPYVAYRPGM